MALSYSLHYLQRELFLGTCECLAPFLRAWQRAVNDATGAETAFAAARDEIGKIGARATRLRLSSLRPGDD